MKTVDDIAEKAIKKGKVFYKKGQDEVESLADQLSESASDLYEDALNTMNQFDKAACDYTGELINKVKEKPLTSLVIAGGLGFILYHLLKKQ